MKKQAGFTLAELVVSMGIFVLIIGAIVVLFSTSLKAMILGKEQETAYAQARMVMNDLKTTLRYAEDKEKIDATSTTTTLEYKGSMNIGNDPGQQTAQDYERQISWDGANKRLAIRWKYYYPGKDVTTSSDWQGPIYFPEDADKNGAFDSPEYLAAYNKMLDGEGNNVSGMPFPIFKASYQGGDVFNIVLPIKYKFENSYKIDVLRSRVTAVEYEEKVTDDSRFTGATGMNAKNQAFIDRVLATTPPSNVGSTWRSQDLLWRWLNLTDTGNIMGPGYEEVTA